MLHLWKHAFTFYLHVSIQSTLKQIYKWLVQKFYLSLQESVTVEIWPKIVKLAINDFFDLPHVCYGSKWNSG